MSTAMGAGGFPGLLGPPVGAEPPPLEAPAIFSDLSLDRVVAEATKGRERYDLAPLFARPLADGAAVAYRQRVCADLEVPAVRHAIDAFATEMIAVHTVSGRGDRASYSYQKLAYYREAVERYVTAVETLARDLPSSPIRSEGLTSLAAFLAGYVTTPAFRGVAVEVRDLGRELARLAYAVRIRGSRITVLPYGGEGDYSAEIERTFERFRQGDSKRYDFVRHRHPEMNPIEEEIFDRVAAIFPAPFARLRALGSPGASRFDPTVLRFEREVQFFLAYLDLIGPLRARGLSFGYPELSPTGHELSVRSTFDLALATDISRQQGSVVVNDIALTGVERILVVTGPNQGGKTTFARTVGQLAYLARLGLPVPGADPRLPLCDRVFTLFERGERPENLRGKLQEELVAVREILRAATDRSVIVLNETFSSTSVQDAVGLGRRVLDDIAARGALAVYVTFVDELATGDPARVSVVAGVSPSDPTIRTFLLRRAPPNGRAFAVAIAEKYGLSYAQLRARTGA